MFCLKLKEDDKIPVYSKSSTFKEGEAFVRSSDGKSDSLPKLRFTGKSQLCSQMGLHLVSLWDL